MSTRCIQPKHLLSLFAILAIAIWPSVSKAVDVQVYNYNPTGSGGQPVSNGVVLNGSAFDNIVNGGIVVQCDSEADAITEYNILTNYISNSYNNGAYETGTPGIDSDATGITGHNSAFTDPQGITGIGIAINDANASSPYRPNDPGWSTWNTDEVYNPTTKLYVQTPVSVGPYSILIGFTYNGDTDMDGAIEPYDIGNAESAYIFDHSQGDWTNGGSDYSGAMDPTDLGNIEAAYLFQGQDAIVNFTNVNSVVSNGVVVGVPEPGTFALAGIAVLGLLFAFGIRRRRLSMVAA